MNFTKHILLSQSQEESGGGAGAPSKDSPDERKTFDPVLFGKLVGRQELRVRVKQAENIPGPKVSITPTITLTSIIK